jgi:S-disulfanyl-L-cysteine oxidoreductase SoxD
MFRSHKLLMPQACSAVRVFVCVFACVFLGVSAPTFLYAQTVQKLPSTKTAQKPWNDIGRPATTNEVKAWDIDVRPDFKGLPAGSGSVVKGEVVWEAQCASCHGTFGESNEVFTPIVGGVTKDDSKTGLVANLRRSDYPQRTSLMKLSSISTLWDYINRAMPWNAPKSLTVDEVYAVTAYILHLGDVLPADYVLSDRNIAQVQAILPNRNGTTSNHGLWKVTAKPDVQGSACMKDCKPYEIRSQLPDYARNAHGNLADQNRFIGAVRGAVSTANAVPTTSKGAETETSGEGEKLAKASNCFACHAQASKLLGPSFKEVAAKYKGDAGAAALLAQRIKNGAQGVWGAIPMPANPQLQDDALKQIVQWVLSQ